LEILEILKTKRAKNKKVESKKFGNIRNIEVEKGKYKKVLSEKFEKVEILKTKTFNTYGRNQPTWYPKIYLLM
jgi:hypothetical protein